MNAADLDLDLTPTLALRKLTVLFEGGRLDECATLLRRLTDISLDAILERLPVDALHDAIPASLPILEAIYVKALQRSPDLLPTDKLRTDQLLQRMVALFARQCSAAGDTNGGSRNCNTHMPFCRSILRVVMATAPGFRRSIAQRKRALERCLRRMGQHGLVSGAGGQLTTLHEALRAEFEGKVAQFKAALGALEQLAAGTRHARQAPAGPEAGHYRLMQASRAEVQERLIKNRKLLTAAEPAEKGAHVSRLLRVLRARTEYDKVLLFHDTELRKMGAPGAVRCRLPAGLESPPPPGAAASLSPSETRTNPQSPQHQQQAQQQIAETLLSFRMGYSAILRAAREVEGKTSEEEDDEETGEDSLSEDEEREVVEVEDISRPTPRASSSRRQRQEVVSLNGIRVPVHYVGPPGSAGRHRSRQLPSLGSRGRSKDAGLQATPAMEGEGEGKGDDGRTKNLTASDPCLAPMAGSVTTTSLLQQEIAYLQQELAVAHDRIQCLQAQEKQLKECLSDRVHQHFQMGNQQFEDLTLGSQRPTVLIRRFGDLYLDGRVEALDSLDQMMQLKDLSDLKIKILFSVVVLAFKAAQQSVNELRGQLRHLLHLPTPPSASHRQNLQQVPHNGFTSSSPSTSYVVVEMEMHITSYLCKTVDTFDVSELVFDVSQQIYNTLYDYPCLRTCQGLLDYASQCVRLAWGLSVQRKPYTIVYDARKYDSSYYTRFHTSDPNSDEIRSFLWPSLVDSVGTCVSKGVVIT